MPVTLGEVIAAPCSATAEEGGEESSGMVPSLDVPVRLGPKIFPCSYDGEIRRFATIYPFCSESQKEVGKRHYTDGQSDLPEAEHNYLMDGRTDRQREGQRDG